MKRPSFQLYPGDWLRDAISGCSLAAQGLWLRLMFVMHDSEPYGQTMLPHEQLARRCGCSLREFGKLFEELRQSGVPTIADGDVIISRRMVKDEAERGKTAERQRRFYGNHNAKPSGQPNADLTPISQGSSSSTSSSVLSPNGERGVSLSLKRQQSVQKDVNDAEWIAGLKQDIAYKHIDIDAEMSKWHRWCIRKRHKPTQARFEAWLNRIEKPFEPVTNGTTAPKGENVW